MNDTKSTWLRIGPLSPEDREASLASLRDGDLTLHEVASLLGCTEAEARVAAGMLGLIEDDLADLSGDRPAIANRLLLEIVVWTAEAHRADAIGDLRGWIRAGGPLPDWSISPIATRIFHRASRGVCSVPWPASGD